MTKYSLLLLLLVGLPGAIRAQGQYLVGTYNIRYLNPLDTGNLWDDRKEHVANLIRFHNFDVLGTQEGFKEQLDYLAIQLPEYDYYGKGRDDGKHAGEHSGIFYRKNKFKLLEKGDFWLSQTPDKPSMGWDAKCCHRICSWVYLEDIKTKKRFYFFNAHFDHQGKIARIESGKLTVAKIKAIATSKPAVFTGDLNGGHQSEWYLTIASSSILDDSYGKVEHPYAPNGSSNGFRKSPGTRSKQIIDHIFVSDHFNVLRWGILTDTYEGKYPSDHFPVLTEIQLK